MYACVRAQVCVCAWELILYAMTHALVWFEWSICVTWLIHTHRKYQWDLVWKTKPYVWHDSLYMWHDSYICDMTLSICDKTRPYGFHQSVPPVIWLIYICDVTRPYEWHDPYVWHDPSKRVPNVAPMPIVQQRWKLNASSTPHPIFAHPWHLKKWW